MCIKECPLGTAEPKHFRFILTKYFPLGGKWLGLLSLFLRISFSLMVLGPVFFASLLLLPLSGILSIFLLHYCDSGRRHRRESPDKTLKRTFSRRVMQSTRPMGARYCSLERGNQITGQKWTAVNKIKIKMRTIPVKEINRWLYYTSWCFHLLGKKGRLVVWQTSFSPSCLGFLFKKSCT